jgi:hypothetical protein
VATALPVVAGSGSTPSKAFHVNPTHSWVAPPMTVKSAVAPASAGGEGCQMEWQPSSQGAAMPSAATGARNVIKTWSRRD